MNENSENERIQRDGLLMDDQRTNKKTSAAISSSTFNPRTFITSTFKPFIFLSGFNPLTILTPLQYFKFI